jgi:hypothetical protein
MKSSTLKKTSFKPKADWKPLKRSAPLARGTSTLKQTKPMAPVGKRAKRMRQGRVKPTAEEQAWLDDVSACGCLVCFMQGHGEVPGEIHHIKDGDRRLGHLFSINLCPSHHRGGASEGQFISRHPYKARFERAYGKELDLLDIQKGRVALLRAGRAVNRMKALAKAA